MRHSQPPSPSNSVPCALVSPCWELGLSLLAVVLLGQRLQTQEGWHQPPAGSAMLMALTGVPGLGAQAISACPCSLLSFPLLLARSDCVSNSLTGVGHTPEPSCPLVAL